MARRIVENSICSAMELSDIDCIRMINDAYKLTEQEMTMEDIADYGFLFHLLLAPVEALNGELTEEDKRADSSDEEACAAASIREEKRCRALGVMNVRNRGDYAENKKLIISAIAAVEAASNKVATLKILGAGHEQVATAMGQLSLILKYFRLVADKIDLLYDYENFYSHFESGDDFDESITKEYTKLKTANELKCKAFLASPNSKATLIAFLGNGSSVTICGETINASCNLSDLMIDDGK